MVRQDAPGGALLPNRVPVNLPRLGGWLLFGLLGAILGLHIVRSAADLLTEPCPGADTVFQRAALQTTCPDDR